MNSNAIYPRFSIARTARGVSTQMGPALGVTFILATTVGCKEAEVVYVDKYVEGGVEYVDEPSYVQESPPAGGIQLVFPGKGVALNTSSVEISVYERTQGQDDICHDILERRKSEQELPSALSKTGRIDTCECVVSGASSWLNNVPFKDVAVLVVGYKVDVQNPQRTFPYVIGCATTNVDRSNLSNGGLDAGDRPAVSVVDVQLGFFDPSVARVDDTTCQLLADKCHGYPSCPQDDFCAGKCQ